MATVTRERTGLASDAVRELRERFVPRGLSVGTPVVVARAVGSEVWDPEGKRYLDFVAGIGALNIAHLPYPYPYRPLAPLEGDDLAELYVRLFEQALDTNLAPEHVAAVIIEPIQGEGGFIVPPARFLKRIAAICRRHDILFIADEIQTGMARTGRTFAI